MKKHTKMGRSNRKPTGPADPAEQRVIDWLALVPSPTSTLAFVLDLDTARVRRIVARLCAEGFVVANGNGRRRMYGLALAPRGVA